MVVERMKSTKEIHEKWMDDPVDLKSGFPRTFTLIAQEGLFIP